MIKSKVETLGKTANDAVINFAKENDENDESDDDGESSDDDDEQVVNSDEDDSIEETAIDVLITRISSWAHILPPRK